jgi:hypothetical protein
VEGRGYAGDILGQPTGAIQAARRRFVTMKVLILGVNGSSATAW